MPRWRERADGLLYEGEDVRDVIDLEGAGVVVTSHRVLAFTPGTKGANFRQADRPNVDGVDTGAQSEAGLLERAVRFGVVGVVLVVAGFVIDFEGIVGDVDLTGGQTAGQVGIGGILGPLQAMLDLLRNLDQFMQLFGALALLLAAVLLGVYWYLREPTLVIEIAGGDDVHVPRPDGESDAIGRLERAIAPGASAGDGGTARDRDRATSGRGDDPLGES